jgi:hypothetical protein
LESFAIGAEYNHIGDRQSVDAKLYHKGNSQTEVATAVELNLGTSGVTF